MLHSAWFTASHFPSSDTWATPKPACSNMTRKACCPCSGEMHSSVSFSIGRNPVVTTRASRSIGPTASIREEKSLKRSLAAICHKVGVTESRPTTGRDRAANIGRGLLQADGYSRRRAARVSMVNEKPGWVGTIVHVQIAPARRGHALLPRAVAEPTGDRVVRLRLASRSLAKTVISPSADNAMSILQSALPLTWFPDCRELLGMLDTEPISPSELTPIPAPSLHFLIETPSSFGSIQRYLVPLQFQLCNARLFAKISLKR